MASTVVERVRVEDADEDISGVYLELRRHLVRDALFRPHPNPYYG
jgi:hypothetical protein